MEPLDEEAVWRADFLAAADGPDPARLLAEVDRRRRRQSLVQAGEVGMLVLGAAGIGGLACAPAAPSWLWTLAALWWIFAPLFAGFALWWRRGTWTAAGGSVLEGLRFGRRQALRRIELLRGLRWLVAAEFAALAAVNASLLGAAGTLLTLAILAVLAVALAGWWRREIRGARAQLAQVEELLAAFAEPAPGGGGSG